MNAFEAARMIDISAVRTHHTREDIVKVVEIAREYRFVNVHALPAWTKMLSEMLKGDPDIRVGAPVGFPGGGHRTIVKLMEAQALIEDGVEEMDVVMNVGKFKDGAFGEVLNELRAVVGLAPEGVLTKVIIELNCLTDREIPDACNLVIDSGADFLKTGTGWVPGDANIDRIARIKELTAGQVMVKAAGGVRTRAEFDALAALGVERFGINTQSALEIVRSFDEGEKA